MSYPRLPRLSRLSLAALFTTPLLTASGCLEHPIKPVEYQKVGICDERVDVTPNRDVDILFVIDNSGSMGEEQAILSANFERFIDKLEAENVEADYRIAVTTTDVTHSIYCHDSTPEGGAFVMSTCLDRIDDFEHAALGIDKRAEACESLCPAEFAGALPIATAIEPGGEEVMRPWIQNINKGTNLPDGMSTTQAFQCFGPQGISGCGYHESPLEAMNRAILRSKDPKDPAYGFIREGAMLAVVMITDENECSVANHALDIFHPQGDKTFWEDPDAPAPTSAVCWNAGVDCDDTGMCWSQDHAYDGSPTDDPSEAVLHPLSRYVDVLVSAKGLSSVEEADNVLVSLIAGVPTDYPDSAIPYGDSQDPDFQDKFGVGAGCVSADGGTATPPVRLKEFADQFLGADDNNVFSVCADDYSPALDNLADRIRAQIKPSCMTACVADTDPQADGVQPECVLTEILSAGAGAGTTERELVHCDRDDAGWALPAGEDTCFHEVTAFNGTMHELCEEMGANVEFKVLRAPGTFAPSNSAIEASCVLSETPSAECPLLEESC